MKPQSDSSIHQDKLYTMRELNQHTADVIREINESGKPALITRRGRFVAVISPVSSGQIEAEMAAKVLMSAEHRGQLLGEHTLSEVEDTAAVAEEVGVTLPKYPDREV